MKRFNKRFDKIFAIMGSKPFVIAFGASLAVVLLALILIFVIFGGGEAEDVFLDAPPILYVPMPIDEGEEVECETCETWDEPPYPTLFSVLTGERIYEGYATRRPLAVVVNNIRRALPQSGIASADVVYEVLAEGDVTRLVAIFQSYFPETIGSVRSARDYFIDFAWNHDAIFIFHGASPTGHSRIRSTGIDRLDGGALEGTVFWRDRTYPDWALNTGTRPMEHSAFTGRERLEAHIYSTGIRAEMSDDPAYGFNFGDPRDFAASLGNAHRIVVPFSTNYTRTFVFCEESNMYLVENRDGALLDGINAEQAAVRNVLIKFTPKAIIAGDYAGRRNVQTVGSGRGYLATGGDFFEVTWQKDSHTSPVRWFFADGTPLTLSPGSTWICVFQHTGVVAFE